VTTLCRILVHDPSSNPLDFLNRLDVRKTSLGVDPGVRNWTAGSRFDENPDGPRDRQVAERVQTGRFDGRIGSFSDGGSPGWKRVSTIRVAWHDVLAFNYKNLYFKCSLHSCYHPSRAGWNGCTALESRTPGTLDCRQGAVTSASRTRTNPPARRRELVADPTNSECYTCVIPRGDLSCTRSAKPHAQMG